MELEVFRLTLAAEIRAEIHGHEIRASLGEINWKELERIGRPAASLVAELLEVDCSGFVESKSLTMPAAGYSKASLTYSVDFPLSENQRQEISTVVRQFIERVVRVDRTIDLFNHNDSASVVVDIVADSARQFVEKNGDKKINAPFVLEIPNSEGMLCKGAFVHKKSSSLIHDSMDHFHSGQIIGMGYKTKLFRIENMDGEVVDLHYEDDATFFQALCDIYKYRETKTFVTKLKPRLKKSPINILIDIRAFDGERMEPQLQLESA